MNRYDQDFINFEILNGKVGARTTFDFDIENISTRAVLHDTEFTLQGLALKHGIDGNGFVKMPMLTVENAGIDLPHSTGRRPSIF